MLEQLGSEGRAELECGSHVSRLQGKLPHELRTSFKRHVHPSRITVPTLLDFADWLEYELQVQDDTSRTVTCAPDSSIKRRDGRYDSKPLVKPTSILMGTEKPLIDREPRVSAPRPDLAPTRTEGSHVPTALIVTMLAISLMDVTTSKS